MELMVISIRKDEIRRGWVRINQKTRNYIKSGSLIEIKCDKNSVKRIVIGFIDENCIVMDEPTREELGMIETNRTYNFEIKELKGIMGFWGSLTFYWNHPDFPMQFSTKIAVISFALGIISLILGILAFF